MIPPSYATTLQELKDAYDDVRRKVLEIWLSIPAEALPMWVIHGPDTIDQPGLFVARLWQSLPQPNLEAPVVRAGSLESLRSLLPPGLVRLDRDENDAPTILETWL
jgi:hypothetical protein